jgi:hypothetical protein
VREAGDEGFDELRPFIGLASEWDGGAHRERIPADIRTEALRLLARHGVSPGDG